MAKLWNTRIRLHNRKQLFKAFCFIGVVDLLVGKDQVSADAHDDVNIGAGLVIHDLRLDVQLLEELVYIPFIENSSFIKGIDVKKDFSRDIEIHIDIALERSGA